MYFLLVLLAFTASVQSESCNNPDEIRHSLLLAPTARLDCRGVQPTMPEGVVTFDVKDVTYAHMAFTIEDQFDDKAAFRFSIDTSDSIWMDATKCSSSTSRGYVINIAISNFTGTSSFDWYPAKIRLDVTGISTILLTIYKQFITSSGPGCIIKLSTKLDFTGRPTSTPTLSPTLAPTLAPAYTRDPVPLSCHALNALLVAQDCATAINIERVQQTTFGDAVYYYTCRRVYTTMYNGQCLENMDTPGPFSGWHE